MSQSLFGRSSRIAPEVVDSDLPRSRIPCPGRRAQAEHARHARHARKTRAGLLSIAEQPPACTAWVARSRYASGISRRSVRFHCKKQPLETLRRAISAPVSLRSIPRSRGRHVLLLTHCPRSRGHLGGTGATRRVGPIADPPRTKIQRSRTSQLHCRCTHDFCDRAGYALARLDPARGGRTRPREARLEACESTLNPGRFIAIELD